MSIFNLFIETSTPASIICIKNKKTNCYDCKMGLNYEGILFKTNGFKYKNSFCDSEVENFIKSLGATDTKVISDVRRWVFMNNCDDNKNIYSFGESEEIHITKDKQLK